jgi:hypothetical protein
LAAKNLYFARDLKRVKAGNPYFARDKGLVADVEMSETGAKIRVELEGEPFPGDNNGTSGDGYYWDMNVVNIDDEDDEGLVLTFFQPEGVGEEGYPEIEDCEVVELRRFGRAIPFDEVEIGVGDNNKYVLSFFASKGVKNPYFARDIGKSTAKNPYFAKDIKADIEPSEMSEMPDLEGWEELEEGEQEPALMFARHVGEQHFNVDDFREAYQGRFDRGLLEYAEGLFDEEYPELPENLRYYIDYELYARDLDANGYWEKDGHVFRPV